MENYYSYFTEKINHLENRVDNLEKLVMQLSNHLLHGSLEVDADSRREITRIVKKIDEEQNPYRLDSLRKSPWYYANEWE